MKSKAAKFIAISLMIFILLTNFSACKSDVKTKSGDSAESVADICLKNRKIWEFDENSFPGKCGYYFIDLDFDGVPELVSTTTQGSEFFTTDLFYKINAEKETVDELLFSGNGSADFIFGTSQESGYPKLLRGKDGNMFYFCRSYSRASAGNYSLSYSRVTVSGGKVRSELLFSEDVFTQDDSSTEHKYYSYASGKHTELSEQQYSAAVDAFFAENADMHLTVGCIDSNEFSAADTAGQRKMLAEAYRSFGYNGR